LVDCSDNNHDWYNGHLLPPPFDLDYHHHYSTTTTGTTTIRRYHHLNRRPAAHCTRLRLTLAALSCLNSDDRPYATRR
jgi:hypothetical protein